MRRWFRMFMRKRMTPMSVSHATKRKENLSLAYVFFAWNAAGLLAYQLVKENYPMTEEEKKRPGQYYARLWQGENVQVIHIDGFTQTRKYQIEGIPQLHPPEEFPQEVVKELDY